jgi:hypothetical protein
VFQTTFDISEWRKTPGKAANDAQLAPVDGISGNGGWDTRNGSLDQITTAANNPSGGGGRGFRHWIGDGVNNSGGGIRITFPATSEMWIRYYIRYQRGFGWGRTINHKQWHAQGRNGGFYFGLHQGVIGGVNGGRSIHHSAVTWTQMQGSWTGDGKFHCIELHVKMNSSGSSSDGVFEFWLNGVQIYSATNVHFSNSTGATWSSVFTSNHNDPQNGGVDAYVDYDDIAISTTGYIGPISTAKPAPPTPESSRRELLPASSHVWTVSAQSGSENVDFVGRSLLMRDERYGTGFLVSALRPLVILLIGPPVQ